MTALSQTNLALARTTAAPPLDLGAVYETEFDYVWHSLRRLGVNERDLEDIAHEVFLILHRRVRDFDATRPLRPWLFGILVRVAADYRGSARYRREQLQAEPMPDGEDSSGSRPDQELAALQKRRMVQEALERLDFKHRTVFVMHELNGHTVPEIASALDLPLNTLYSRLRNGRQQFAAAVRRLNLQGGAA